MSGLPRELRDLIESGPLAHLSTINADGSPQVSVIWVGLDGDDLVSGHMKWYAKLRNIERDPRVVLSFEAPREPGVFLNPYAVLHARATIQPSDDAWNLLDRLTKVYMSPDTEFPAPKVSRLYRALLRRAHRRRRPLGVSLALRGVASSIAVPALGGLPRAVEDQEDVERELAPPLDFGHQDRAANTSAAEDRAAGPCR